MEWKKQEGNTYWNPKEKNEQVEGVIINTFENEQKDGSKTRHYVILDKKLGEITTSSHRVLVARMKNVKEKDIVRIIFLGEELPTVKGQNPTKMYDVFIYGE